MAVWLMRWFTCLHMLSGINKAIIQNFWLDRRLLNLIDKKVQDDSSFINFIAIAHRTSMGLLLRTQYWGITVKGGSDGSWNWAPIGRFFVVSQPHGRHISAHICASLLPCVCEFLGWSGVVRLSPSQSVSEAVGESLWALQSSRWWGRENFVLFFFPLISTAI